MVFISWVYNITTDLTVRSLCLEACEACKIIAINDEERKIISGGQGWLS